MRHLRWCVLAFVCAGCANKPVEPASQPVVITPDPGDVACLRLRAGGDLGKLLGVPPSLSSAPASEAELRRQVHAQGGLPTPRVAVGGAR